MNKYDFITNNKIVYSCSAENKESAKFLFLHYCSHNYIIMGEFSIIESNKTDEK